MGVEQQVEAQVVTTVLVETDEASFVVAGLMLGGMFIRAYGGRSASVGRSGYTVAARRK